MKLYFTLEERTSGLYRASLALTALFLILAVAAGFYDLLTLQFLAIPYALMFLAIAVPVAMISCQVFGHPIWFLGDALKLNGTAYSIFLDTLTGIIMQITFGYFITDGAISFHPIAGTIMAITGALCGVVAFNEADAMRRERHP